MCPKTGHIDTPQAAEAETTKVRSAVVTHYTGDNSYINIVINTSHWWTSCVLELCDIMEQIDKKLSPSPPAVMGKYFKSSQCKQF